MRSTFCRTRRPSGSQAKMPGACRRIYPALTSHLWLATSASLGSSRSVRTKSWERSVGTRTDYPGLDRDDLGRALRGVRHFGSKTIGFLDQRLDDFRLRNRLDDFALHKDLALAVTAGNTQVSFPGFTRSIHHTPHDGNAQGNGHTFETLGDVFCERVDINLSSTTTGAGHNLQLA